ncbi:MAG: PAS domain S-box protein [Halorientalis sp.]
MSSSQHSWFLDGESREDWPDGEDVQAEVLDTISDVLYVVDRRGRFVDWNARFPERTGYSDDEIAQLHEFDIIPDAYESEAEALLGAVAEGEEVTLEAPLVTKDGERIPHEFTAAPLTDDDGQVWGMVGTARDISELVEAQDRLRERERRFSTLVANLPGMVYRCANDRGWPMAFVSEGCRDLTGYDPDHLESGTVSWGRDVIHPDDRKDVWTRVQQALADEEPFTITYRVFDSDGELRWVWEQGRGVYDDGEIEAIEGFIADITERKRREQNLERYERLIETIGDAMYVVGEDLRLEEVNDAFESMFGLDRDDAVGTHITELVTEETARTGIEVRRDLNDSEEQTVATVEGTAIDASGELFPIEVRFIPLTGDLAGLGLVRDISDRKDRAALFESLHEGMRELMDAESVAEVAVTAAGVIGEHFENTTTGVRLLRNDTLELVAVETDGARFEASVQSVAVGEGVVGQAYDRGEPVIVDDLERMETSLDSGPARSAMFLPIDGYGMINVAAAEPSAFDETDLELGRLFVADVNAAFERADREQQLRERKRELENYETLVETMSDGVYMTDADNEVSMVNDAIVDLLGRDRETLLGQSVDTFGNTDDIQPYRDALRDDEIAVGQIEDVIERPDGRERHVENRFSLLPSQQGFRGTVGVVRDITDRKQREHLVRRLHQVLGNLMAAETTQAVADRAAAAAEQLGFDVIAVRLLDETGQRLELAGQAATTGHLSESELPPVTVGAGLIGTVYEHDETVVIDDLQTLDLGYDPSPARSGMLIPMAGHGVLSIGSTNSDGFDEMDLELGRLFAADVQSALERAEREQQLRERKRELENYETLVETMSDGVYMTDADHEITMANGAMTELTGYSRQELLGMDIAGFLDEDVARRGEAERQQVIDSGDMVGQFDGEFRTLDGQTVAIENRFALLPSDNQFEGTVGVVRDISEQKEREERLKTQRDELETLNRINELVQETIGTLASATTREDIESRVCDRLAGSSLYRFAVIGAQPPGSQYIDPQTWAGEGAEYLSVVDIPADSSLEGAGPAARTIETGSVTVTHDVESDPLFEPFRDAALDHGFRSVALVPLTYGDVVHGILAVYADRADAFSDREIQAFEVLGEMVGFAISATQNRRLIESDRKLELTFDLDPARSLGAAISTTHDCTCSLLGAAEASDGEIIHYMAVTTADPEAIIATATDSEFAPEDIRVIRTDGETVVLEVRFHNSIPSVLIDSGVKPVETVAEDGRVRVVVEAPLEADIRRLMDRLDDYGDVSLVSKREIDGWEAGTESLRERLRADLTDRQQAALNAAYFGGVLRLAA